MAAENSKAERSRTKKKRVPGRPFPKGMSGNPGGRPKDLAEVKALAREHSALAIRTLASIATKNRSAVARIMAAKELLDRAWGKAAQAVELTGRDGKPIQTEDVRRPDLSRLDDGQIEQLEALLVSAHAGGGEGGEGSAQAR